MLFVLLFLFFVVLTVIAAKAALELTVWSFKLNLSFKKSENLEFIEACFARTRETNREHFTSLRLERESGSQWGEAPCPFSDPFYLEQYGSWEEFRPEAGEVPAARYFQIANNGWFADAKTRMTTFGKVKDRQDQLSLREGAHGPELVFEGQFDEKVADVVTIITGPISEENPAHIVWTWHPGDVFPPFDEEQLVINKDGSFDAPDDFPVKLAKKKSSEMRWKK